MVDEQKMALQVGAFNISQEDYGMYLIFGLPLGDNSLESLVDAMDEEVVKIQQELISEKDYQKLQNKFEADFVNSNASVEGIANSLAEYYTFYGDTNRINTEIDVYRSITREEIQAVAKKYLIKNERLVLDYLQNQLKNKRHYEKKFIPIRSIARLASFTSANRPKSTTRTRTAPKIQLDEPQEFVLKNGLRVWW